MDMQDEYEPVKQETESDTETAVEPQSSKESGHRKGKNGRQFELLKKMVMCAIFVALAFAAEFVLRIKVGFLTFDAKDAILTVGAMCLGPIPGVAMTLCVSLLEMLTVSDTGLWGFLMNFVSSAAFCVPAALIYRRWHTLVGALAGLFVSVIGMTGVMMLMNLWVTPIYMGVERSVVVGMIPTMLLPFNLIKAVLNAALVFLFYKPVVTALRLTHMVETGGQPLQGRRSVVVTILALLVAAGAVVLFIFVMQGSFQWVKPS